MLADILACYMPEHEWDTADHTTACSQDSMQDKPRLESMKLIWPSSQYMSAIKVDEGESDDALVFFLPQTLALMEPDLHCQMHLYEGWGLPCPFTRSGGEDNPSGTELCVPHNKTYLRLMSSESKVSLQHHPDNPSDQETVGCACSDIAWMLLTSACLSKGKNRPILCGQAKVSFYDCIGAQGEFFQPACCEDCGHIRQVSYPILSR